MKPKLSLTLRRAGALLVPIALGIWIFAALTGNKDEAPRDDITETARRMRVIEVSSMPVVPRTEGFGVANADRAWRAIARVGGHVTEVHPDLRSGSRVKDQAMLVQIDTTDVDIAIASARAEVARLTAELKKLDLEESNNTSSLAIEQDILQVLEIEVERLKGLTARGASSQAEYEKSQRSLLAQKQAVLGIDNSIALLPATRAITQAQLDGANASLAQAERDLEFCTIRSPFAGAVGSTALEVGQYVTANEELFEVSFDGTLRIDAAIPQEQLFHLLSDRERETISAMINDRDRSEDVLAELFSAKVIGTLGRAWPARVVGVRESLDEQTRALRMTVLVDQDGLSKDGPPLSPGAFCRVELRSSAREAIVIPRSAVRGGDAFWLDAENRLRRSTLDIEFTQGELAIVRGGLDRGVKLVVSDATPAIEGQLVDPVVDIDLSSELVREAASGDPR